MQLEPYDFDVILVPRVENEAADSLSRFPEDGPEVDEQSLSEKIIELSITGKPHGKTQYTLDAIHDNETMENLLITLLEIKVWQIRRSRNSTDDFRPKITRSECKY